MFDTGCCGSNLKQDVISKWGVFSLAIPLFYFTLFLYMILWPLSIIPSFKKITRKVEIIMLANWKLTQKVQLLPKIKCQLSSFFYDFYPQLSGSIFKSFNFTLFTFLWIFIVGFLKLGVQLT